ncbi:MAG: alginate lyase family protein [Lewinellaceae bacterium]|nr:alginate lyase family protein [Lewinellaceae bacterium]
MIRYYHTLRHLKPIQLRYRLYYALLNRLRQPRLRQLPYPTPQALQLQSGIEAPEILSAYHSFTFLNQEWEFPAGEIDWNEKRFGKLWAYNLNYFDYLRQQGISVDERLGLVRDFIQKQDQSRDGIEPYPISLRAINWVKFLSRHDIRDGAIDASLFAQLDLLSRRLEYHLLGNHLLENGFGLLFGSYYFNDTRLYRLAEGILRQELAEQVLSDGGHFERSPMYHQTILERLLDAVNLVGNNPGLFDTALLPLLREKAAQMLGWLQQMTFPNGQIPLFNDSAFGIAPETYQLATYATRLGIKPQILPLGESGYRKFQYEGYTLFADAAPVGPDYIPGHAHADTLSVQLQVNGQNLLVDTGTSTYEKDQRRQAERSTAAHNTVQISHWEQSEVWDGFRVARRAYPRILEEQPNVLLRASHDGYARYGYTHTRTIHCEAGRISIEDDVSGPPALPCRAYWHFHPAIAVQLEGNELVTPLGRLAFQNALKIELHTYEYAPEFNKRLEGVKAIVTFEGRLRTECLVS